MTQTAEKDVRQPEYLEMTAPLVIEAADGAKQLPRFSMVAYTGGLMRIEGFPHPVVVDLEGLAIERQNLPIRLDHRSNQGVGHTHRVAVEKGQVVAEGLISRDTSWARDVAKSGANGFPWQASIGAAVLKAEFVPTGGRVEVNGRTFDGPVHVVRRAVLKEISFVDSGADTNTVAKVAAKEDKEQSMKTDTKGETKKTQDIQASGAESKVEAIDPVADIRAAAAAESKRIAAVRKVCAGRHADLEARAIEEGWDETKTELEVLRASRPKAPAVHDHNIQAGPRVCEAIMLMAGGVHGDKLLPRYGEETIEAADRLRGLGIQEFCELAAGLRLPRFNGDASGWLQAAFSTLSLPGILSNVANKLLLEGYDYVEDAWRRICKVASVNDFKEHTRYRMTSDFKFQKVGPDGELKHGKLDEMQFGQKAATHGIMFALTREMIINDDLGAFADVPREIGMGAADAIADAVWELLLSNPNDFFHADHKNYLAGADTALAMDGLTAAEQLFLDQTKPNGRPLGVRAELLLVPTALKVTAELLMSSLKVNETTTANKPKPQDNPHAGKFAVVSSAYLSNATFTGASSKAWYLFADPNRVPALEVAFLNGVDRPTVERADADFNTLGVQFRGYIDFGVREQDWRGAIRMKGEA